MEKLEAKHIAPYLPYKLMFWHTKLKNKQEMSQIKVRQDGDVHVDVESDTLVYISSINDSWIKPILRPIEDLTRVIEWNDGEYCMTDINDFDLDELDYNTVQDYISRHFDIFGLIDKGLAISYSDV